MSLLLHEDDFQSIKCFTPPECPVPCPCPVLLAPSIDEIGKHFCISWLVARLEMTLLATEQYLGNQE